MEWRLQSHRISLPDSIWPPSVCISLPGPSILLCFLFSTCKGVEWNDFSLFILEQNSLYSCVWGRSDFDWPAQSSVLSLILDYRNCEPITQLHRWTSLLLPRLSGSKSLQQKVGDCSSCRKMVLVLRIGSLMIPNKATILNCSSSPSGCRWWCWRRTVLMFDLCLFLITQCSALKSTAVLQPACAWIQYSQETGSMKLFCLCL